MAMFAVYTTIQSKILPCRAIERNSGTVTQHDEIKFNSGTETFFLRIWTYFLLESMMKTKKKTAGFEQARNQDFVKKDWGLN